MDGLWFAAGFVLGLLVVALIIVRLSRRAGWRGR